MYEISVLVCKCHFAGKHIYSFSWSSGTLWSSLLDLRGLSLCSRSGFFFSSHKWYWWSGRGHDEVVKPCALDPKKDIWLFSLLSLHLGNHFGYTRVKQVIKLQKQNKTKQQQNSSHPQFIQFFTQGQHVQVCNYYTHIPKFVVPSIFPLCTTAPKAGRCWSGLSKQQKTKTKPQKPTNKLPSHSFYRESNDAISKCHIVWVGCHHGYAIDRPYWQGWWQ